MVHSLCARAGGFAYKLVKIIAQRQLLFSGSPVAVFSPLHPLLSGLAAFALCTQVRFYDLPLRAALKEASPLLVLVELLTVVAVPMKDIDNLRVFSEDTALRA